MGAGRIYPRFTWRLQLALRLNCRAPLPPSWNCAKCGWVTTVIATALALALLAYGRGAVFIAIGVGVTGCAARDWRTAIDRICRTCTA